MDNKTLQAIPVLLVILIAAIIVLVMISNLAWYEAALFIVIYNFIRNKAKKEMLDE